MVVMSFMDAKLAQVLLAVNGNVHDLHQTNDSLESSPHNRLHGAHSIVHKTHVSSHRMHDLLNPLA